MSLVEYSDSESDADTRASSPRPAKRLRSNSQPASSLPPLPAAFHDLYASSTRVSIQDDPSLHGGRKRAIPHVEGNWPTHVYLEWYPSRKELPLLTDLISQSKSKLEQASDIQSLLHSDLGAQLPLHISLSRPVVLRTEQRFSFTEILQKSVNESQITSFDITPDSLDWVSNYERTRWFLVLRVRKPHSDSLNCLLRLSNDTLARFDQPPLYETASHDHQKSRASAGRDLNGGRYGNVDFSSCFHISLAWTLTEPSKMDLDRVASVDLHPVRGLHVRFDSVKAKIGNNVVSIPLAGAIS